MKTFITFKENRYNGYPLKIIKTITISIYFNNMIKEHFIYYGRYVKEKN